MQKCHKFKLAQSAFGVFLRASCYDVTILFLLSRSTEIFLSKFELDSTEVFPMNHLVLKKFVSLMGSRFLLVVLIFI